MKDKMKTFVEEVKNTGLKIIAKPKPNIEFNNALNKTITNNNS